MSSYDDAGFASSGDLGPLAVALAKAQGEFGAITRSKTVTVKTKTGDSYTFSYAPLDTILGSVRKPLATNGLAITQLLDHGSLVTLLLHESGAHLIARTALPEANNIQAYGSSITYLRRYALQSLLGIAAEEDDDGNTGVGNLAAPVEKPPRNAVAKQEETFYLTRISRTGVIGKGEGLHSRLEFRETPDGHHLGFRLVTDVSNNKAIPQVVAQGAIGNALYALGDPEKLLGTLVDVEGDLFEVHFPGRSTYHRLYLTRIASADWVIPADETSADKEAADAVRDALPTEAASVDMFSPDEEARIDAAVKGAA